MPTVKSPPKNLREVDCQGCGYVLEYRPSEVRHCSADYEEGDPAYDYITCPRSQCKKRTVIVEPPDYIDL